MATDDYQPIACADYDIYEIAIMRGQVLDIHWQDAGSVQHQALLRPTGLVIRDRAEVLLTTLASDPETAVDIRLDRITSVSISSASQVTKK